MARPLTSPGQEHTSSFNGKHTDDENRNRRNFEVSHLAKVLVVLEHGFAFRKIVIEFLNAFFVLAHKSLRQNQFDKATFHASEFHFCFNFHPREKIVFRMALFVFGTFFYDFTIYIFITSKKLFLCTTNTRVYEISHSEEHA